VGWEWAWEERAGWRRSKMYTWLTAHIGSITVWHHVLKLFVPHIFYICIYNKFNLIYYFYLIPWVLVSTSKYCDPQVLETVSFDPQLLSHLVAETARIQVWHFELEILGYGSRSPTSALVLCSPMLNLYSSCVSHPMVSSYLCKNRCTNFITYQVLVPDCLPTGPQDRLWSPSF